MQPPVSKTLGARVPEQAGSGASGGTTSGGVFPARAAPPPVPAAAGHPVVGPAAGRGLTGGGLLAVWSRVQPQDEDDLNRWYAAEHLPERLAVPGFLGARRYRSPGDRTYLALYE